MADHAAAPAYPQLRLDLNALDNNIAVMAAWCRAHQVELAPHVKTTMSEPIVQRQLRAGAAGLTVATAEQARTVRSWGRHPILIANEVVDPAALTLLRSLTEHDDSELRLFVDSVAGLHAAAEIFAASRRGIEVLVDVGTQAGRTGVRTRQQARRLAEAVHATAGVRLIGVAGYEGVVPNSRDGATVGAVDEHCRRVAEVFVDLVDLYETDRPVFTMGGSVFPDRVVDNLPDRTNVPGARTVLRSGCYVTHDHGIYAQTGPLPDLVPALTIRAVVLSTPEPGTVVLGAGKRELPHDAGMPVLVSAATAGGTAKATRPGVMTTMFDHHCVLTGTEGLNVGDVVELGISHPCSAFSRWDSFLTTRDGLEVGLWRTDFSRRSAPDPEQTLPR
jgi:D-serine deaminase-like pyridoxal phosphate-dependent protein